MKKVFYIVLFFVTSFVFSQSNAISYQAVIYMPGGQNAPGVNVTNVPMANKNICLQFKFIDSSNRVEYQEEVKVKTDEFGMVNITIGQGNQTGGYASNFNSIVWSAQAQKNLQVGLDATGLCSRFEELSNEPIASVPFANAAIVAGNVTGVVALVNGGTGATTAAGARANLGIGNVDNTSDLNKPVSNATKIYVDTAITGATIVDADATTKGKLQLAGDLAGTAAAPTVPGLALKENVANKSTTTTLGTSNELFPTQNAVKTYVDTAIAGATIVDADATTKGKLQLAGDLAGTAAAPTVPGLTLKENIANKSTDIVADAASTTKYPSVKVIKDYVDALNAAAGVADGSITSAKIADATIVNADVATNAAIDFSKLNIQKSNILGLGIVKGDLGLGNVDNTSDVAKPVSTATQAALDLKANTTDVTTSLALKEDAANKSTATTLGTSNVLFPTQNAVKTYVDTNITSVNNATTALQNTVTTNETNNTNALALKEDAANKSTATTLGTSDVLFPTQNAVKTYVDTNITTVNSNITTLQGTVNSNATAATSAIAAVQSDVDANETAANAAIALKENAANKSTTTTLGTSDVLFPTQNAVKTYVDASITTVNNTITTNATNTTTALALKEDTANKTLDLTTADGGSDVKFPSAKAVKTYADSKVVDGITDAVTTLAPSQNAVFDALALKENLANKSTDITVDALSTDKYPSVKLIKDYVDSSVSSGAPDATTVLKGKIKLAGDLAGTNSSADIPVISNNAITTVKISNDAVTTDKIADGTIVDADLSATAAIADTKLATIATSGKVSNSATTATDANTASTIVARNSSGDFTAGMITASLTGNVTGNVSGTAANVTGIVAVANGGTGSSTQNFVDLTTAQTVAGAKTFSGNTAVSGSSTLTVGTGATALGGTLGVTGATTLSSTLSAGASTLSSATITNNATVGGTLTATGATTLSSTLDITGNTTVGGTTTLNGNTSVSGTKTFTVGTGATSLGGTLGVTGAATLSSTLGVTGDVAVNTDKFKIAASSGNTEIAGTLGVTGATTLSSTLDITGNTTVGGTTTLNGNTSVSGANTFTVGTGATALGGTLAVTGATTLNGNTSVSGSNTLTVGTGATTLGGTLGVTGATSLGATLGVTGDVAVNSDKFKITATSGNTEIAGTLKIAGGSPSAGKVLTSDATGLGTWTAIPSTNLASAVTGILSGANGGTGVDNSGKTITLGGNLNTLGAHNTTITTTADSNVTLPTTGTLATLAGTETLTNKTLTSPTMTTPTLGVASATSINGLTPTALATGFTIAGGTTSKTLTVSGDATVSGTNTGDQTTITGNAGTATKLATARKINTVDFDGSTDITVTAAAETLTGTTLNSTVTTSSLTSVGTLTNLTVTNPIAGSITGNAATVTNGIYTTSKISDLAATTSAEIAGKISDETGSGTLVFATSPTLVTPTLGEATATSVKFSGSTSGTATLAAPADAGTTTFTLPAASGTLALTSDITSGTATNFSGTLVGDVTGTQGATLVGKINGTSLAGLATGILKNTTSTGVPSIAVASDFPTLNQNTTGSAATLTTARAIYGNNFDGSASLTGIIASTYGGTGNGFTKFTGPTTSEKTFTLPDSNATLARTDDAQTFTGTQTFSSPIAGSITGNAATVTNGIYTTSKISDLAATSSDELAGKISDETGTGTLVFATSPTLVTPNLGTPSAIDLTNATALPLTAGAGVTGVLPVANGGTGSNSQNFVDLTTNQTIAGVKTFSGTSTVVNQNLTVNAAGTTGQGIILSDDGDIVDNNDGAATFRFHGGVKINNGNKSAGTVTTITLANNGNITATGSISGTQLTSTVATGTAPLVVTSTTPVANLNIEGNAATVTNGIYTTSKISALAETTSAELAGVISNETGTGALVFATSPILVTPTLGEATATTVNKVTITAPTTSATLTIADGKTLTTSNSITLAGTDATTMTFPGTSATIARTDAAQTFTGVQTFSSTIAGSINGNAETVTTNANLTGMVTSVGNATSLGSFTSANLATALSDETGTGVVVLATSPTLVTPVIGAATGTSLSVSGQLTSTVATGTAPLVVTSTTEVANLSIGGNAATATNLKGGDAGSIPYQTAAATTVMLAKGSDGQVLTLASGLPSWSNSGGTIATMSATGNASSTASYIIFTGSTASQIITVPSASTVGAGKEITIKNVASVSVSIASAAGRLIQDNSTLDATSAALGIEPSNNWMKLVSDGTNWYIFRALF
jgi:hypothetical protein